MMPKLRRVHILTCPISWDENCVLWLLLSSIQPKFSQTAAFLATFMLGMVLYPEVQARAQAKIDAVVGSARLPTYDDRPSLPYIEALIHELFRWHGPTPLVGSPCIILILEWN